MLVESDKLDRYKISDMIRILLEKNFYYFIPFGFSTVNIGILFGIDYNNATKAEFIFYMLCILVIMCHTFYLGTRLFHSKCLLDIKNWLHYTICFELAIGFIFGLIYSYYPIIAPALLVMSIYGIISLLQYTYWRSYAKIYSKYLLYNLIKNNKYL